ncbi:OmpA family protein [Dyadobacter sandarakinus]|nr:OmpA family protein [Dyadobacter sandarakinus]
MSMLVSELREHFSKLRQAVLLGVLLVAGHAASLAQGTSQVQADPIPHARDFDFNILSVQTKAPIRNARITIVQEGRKDFLPLQSGPGKARVRLDSGKVYLVNAVAGDFEMAQFTFDAGQSLRDGRTSVDLFLIPDRLVQDGSRAKPTQDIRSAPTTRNFSEIKKGEAVRLNHIYFNQSSPDLRPESFEELNRLADLLKEHPGMRIEIRGYTDNTGDFNANVRLSKNRCEAVIAYLTGKGIQGKRLKVAGRGPRDPMAPNDSEENKKKNRRVEFVIL